VFACKTVPRGLAIKATKVRTIRAAFRVGHEWLFERDTQRITDRFAGDGAEADPFRPTHLMERVSRFVEANPGAGKNGIVTAVGGKRTAVFTAIDRLADERWICRAQGANRSQEHYSVRAYREDDDPMLGQVSDELDEVAI
jgi:hypothetical protein